MSTQDPHGHDAGHSGQGGHGPAASPAPAGKPVDWRMVRNVALILATFAAVAAIFSMISCGAAATTSSAAKSTAAETKTASVETNAERTEAERFLAEYSVQFQKLTTESQEAEWLTNVHIVPGDDTNAKRNDAAKQRFAEFTGSVQVIEECRKLLARRQELDPLAVRQLEVILYTAADKPATAPELVKQRIAAETKQVEKLFGFTFRLDGREVSTNDVDRILREEGNLAKRQRAWEASKEVGRSLRSGLQELVRLRNGTVRALGYPDYFTYQVSPYGMTADEMVALNEKVLRQLRPLFRELHTFWRYELAKRYGAPVPDLIPAHWLPNRWGQDWNELVHVEGADLDAALKTKEPEWLVKQAERFYVSLGFEPLPASFWLKSSLYPVPKDAGFKKNNHATAWHIDLDHDVRSLMSVESNREWYETTHHELGHIYYYLSYSTPGVPMVLRDGANPFFHEAIGTMIGHAAMQPRFVAAVGLEASGGTIRPDPIQVLHQEALFYLVFAPFSSGTMTHFEHELYAKELPPERWNARWWELVAKYQGIAPPTARGEEFCDAATKTHLNDNAAQYYKYSLANLFLMQVHDHIARSILHEDPHDTNWFGRKDVGDFLRSILSKGETVDWRKLMRDSIGQELSADATLRYFEPLLKWLQEQNQGRKHTLPDA